MRHTLLFVGARIAIQVDKICLKRSVKRHTIMSNLQLWDQNSKGKTETRTKISTLKTKTKIVKILS